MTKIVNTYLRTETTRAYSEIKCAWYWALERRCHKWVTPIPPDHQCLWMGMALLLFCCRLIKIIRFNTSSIIIGTIYRIKYVYVCLVRWLSGAALVMGLFLCRACDWSTTWLQSQTCSRLMGRTSNRGVVPQTLSFWPKILRFTGMP